MGYEIIQNTQSIEHPLWNFLLNNFSYFVDKSINLILIILFFRGSWIVAKIFFSNNKPQKIIQYKREGQYLFIGICLEVILKILIEIFLKS